MSDRTLSPTTDVYSHRDDPAMRRNVRLVTEVLVCAMPLMFVIMQGPSVSAELLLGSFFPIYRLHRMGVRAHWKVVGLFLAVLSPHILLAWYNPDPINDLQWHYTLLGVVYGVPTGMFLALRAYTAGEGPVRLTWLVATMFLALVFLYVISLIDPTRHVKVDGGEVSRENLEEGEIYHYLGFFFVEDLIIGVIPFTLFALAASVLLLFPAKRSNTYVTLAGAAIATVCNFLVVTRTALVSALAAILVILLAYRPSLRELAVTRVAMMAVLCLATIIGALLLDRQSTPNVAADYAGAMTSRIERSGEDGRVDHWLEGMTLIAAHPGGGSRIKMTTHYWAHNVFIDCGISYGILSLISVLVALTLPVWRALRIFRARAATTSPLFVVLACQLLAVSIAGQLSPPNIPYFLFTMICSGFFASISVTAPTKT